MMMQKKQNKMQSLIKKGKFNITFEVSLYLHHFTSVSLAKQGNYFVMATLNPTASVQKDKSKINSATNLSMSESTKIFPIKYNNHTQALNQFCYFTFSTHANLYDQQKSPTNLLLLFQLYRCRNQPTQQPQIKLINEYELVSHFAFEIKATQQLSFVEYFDVRFQMPYASELVGVATCLMTNFQLLESQTLIHLQNQLLEENKMKSVKAYYPLISKLKKMVKKYRFLSFTVQKSIENIFEGFHVVMTIPWLTGKRQLKQVEISLLTEENLDISRTMEVLEDQQSKSEQGSLQVPKGLTGKLVRCREKKCNEEEFMTYLAFAEHKDKNLQCLLKELKHVGKINKQVVRDIFELVSQKASKISCLERIKLEYENKKSILYSQKITFFGCSLISAAEQMKSYLKHLAIFKSKQKQNYFTDMNQLFHLNPSSQFQNESLQFDKCPYVFHSHQHFYEGVRAQEQLEDLIQVKLGNSKQKPSNDEEFKNVFILAHGYQASCGNMERIKISLKKIFVRSKILLLKSYSQHMDRTLQEMGEKAAQEIETYLHQLSENSTRRIRLIMVGHSMGGIILRSSFRYLSQKVRRFFHTYISIATPHLGYLHCKNLLTETGIKLIQIMHPSVSLKQLSNKDNVNVKQTFVYKLATFGSLREFRNVVVLSSIEDKYVPWNSARIQLYKEPEGVAGKNTTGGWSMNSQKHYLRFVEQQMMNHLLGIGQKEKSKLRNIHRFEVDFHINQINLDTMIGRTAHVAFLANQHIIPIIFQNCLRDTLYAELHSH